MEKGIFHYGKTISFTHFPLNGGQRAHQPSPDNPPNSAPRGHGVEVKGEEGFNVLIEPPCVKTLPPFPPLFLQCGFATLTR